MLNLLVTGSKGQLGSEIKDLEKNYLKYNFFFTDSTSLDITDHLKVKQFIKINKINIIINCAAYTDVDKAEYQFDLANKVNNIAVYNLARISKEYNIKLVHISTDYVFDGNKKNLYVENDMPNPKSVYGQTKLDGEFAIKSVSPVNCLIIRTSWLYSKKNNNFVKKILELSERKNEINVVYDQIGSPTNASDLAKVIITILPKITNKTVKLYHYSNVGQCSRYDFAKEIFRIRNIDTNLNPITTILSSNFAERPSFSALDSSTIKNKFNLVIPNWKKSLCSSLTSFYE